MKAFVRNSVFFRSSALLALLLGGGKVMGLETPDYKVVWTSGNVEYRQYESYAACMANA